jgi:DNA-binding NarL/FixJ family response regulator
MRTVAIAEPDAIMSLLLKEICRTSGYEVVGRARDERSAASLVDRERPDFLLLEYRLGDSSDGLDLIAHAKRHCPALFAIMITAWDICDIAERKNGSQPDRILRKPVHTNSLIEVMAEGSRNTASCTSLKPMASHTHSGY